MRQGDPQFDKLLLSFGLVSRENIYEDKKFLYYYVCIIVRFILFTLAFVFRDYKYLPHIVFVLALISAINLSIGLYRDNNQWWSKKFQLIIAVLLMITSVLLISRVISNDYLIPFLLYTSLIGGILQSLLV